ncbi:hypothetical protein DMC30DRAFT_408981 [Rhodotorula diobovata]|uniref:UBA domain-containing protein n=1 Tax=Rhodotorula diobovata TaxID=5288 RepID=A0A5C5FW41_9BASI|nr:hypothetical protein DMC30DRAFT_408981 [Rhodotorula diobovata]
MPDPSLAALVSLGIDKQKAAFALREHGGDVEAAADWCLSEGATWTPASLLETAFAPPASAARPSPSPPATHTSSRGRRPAVADDPSKPAGWRPVPHRLLPPGTRVRITLKQDQGTDVTQEGVVAERLTRGDHPRGVKVRLEDGRVGRVVSVVR